MLVERGDIYYADLSPAVGSEQGGIRPVLVIQNDTGNKHSPTVIVAAITSQLDKARLPVHITLNKDTYGLSKSSVLLLEQLRTIDKRRLRSKAGHLSEDTMLQVDICLICSLGIDMDRYIVYLQKQKDDDN